jgi:alanine dehydrogenase
MRHLDAIFSTRIETVHSTADSIERHIQDADLMVGGVIVVSFFRNAVWFGQGGR